MASHGGLLRAPRGSRFASRQRFAGLFFASSLLLLSTQSGGCHCPSDHLIGPPPDSGLFPDGARLPPDAGAPDANTNDSGLTDAGAPVPDSGFTADGGGADGGDGGAVVCVPFDGGLIAGATDGGASTRGTEFWLAYMENLSLATNGPPRFSLFVEAFADTHGTTTLFSSGASLPFFAPGGSVTEVLLPSGQPLYAQGSETISNLVLRVSTDQPVGLRAMHWRSYFSDATMVLPTSELGDEYSVVAVDGDTGPSEFVVVATGDETQVTITPSATTAGFHAAGVPFIVTLDAGQSYQVQSAFTDPLGTLSPTGDLSGTHITSTGGPIAVFGGAVTSDTWCSPADNHLWDQLLPNKRLGRSYTLVPFAGQGGDPFKVVAIQDNTQVTFGCGTPSLLLDAGQAIVQVVATPTRLTASAPVAVAQFDKSYACDSSDWGDPGMVILVPDALTQTQVLVRTIYGNAWSASPQLVATSHFVNVVGYGPGAVAVNDCSTGVQLNPPDGGKSWSTAQLLLQYTPYPPSTFPDSGATFVGAGAPTNAGATYALSFQAGFTGVAYGFGQYDGYSYSLGYDCADCVAGLLVDAGCP